MFNRAHLSDHNIAPSVQAILQFAREQQAMFNHSNTGLNYTIFAVNGPSFEQFILCTIQHLGTWEMTEYVQQFMDMMEPNLSFACWPGTTLSTL